MHGHSKFNNYVYLSVLSDWSSLGTGLKARSSSTAILASFPNFPASSVESIALADIVRYVVHAVNKGAGLAVHGPWIDDDPNLTTVYHLVTQKIYCYLT
jgi:hypothetical protein